MGKRKRPQHRPRKKPPAPTPTPHKHITKIVEWAVGILASVLTIAGFWLSNAPRVKVDGSESVSSFSPMGTIFYLNNEGMLPIYDVAVSCANLKIEGENLQVL